MNGKGTILRSMKGLRCLACAAAEAGLGDAQADSPFVAALAYAQVYTFDRVRAALCARHQEHFRSVRSVIDRQSP